MVIDRIFLQEVLAQSGRQSHMAEAALRWLDDMRLESVEQLGPFGDRNIHAGMTVIVRKGSAVDTYHPAYPDGKVAGRNFKVEVTQVFPGTLDTHWHSHKVSHACRNQIIRWRGSGSYWWWTERANVDLIG